MKNSMMWQPKPRKKLKMSADGKLSYPHPFVVGQMIRYKDEWGKVFPGYGIITETDQDKIKIYWQISSNYTYYNIAMAMLRFEIVG